MMREYGHGILQVVGVLRLESSATNDGCSTSNPHYWCVQLAFMNRLTSDAEFAKSVHNEANEVFGGASCERREPSLLQRLGVVNG
jgi:hypothetical protein